MPPNWTCDCVVVPGPHQRHFDVPAGSIRQGWPPPARRPLPQAGQTRATDTAQIRCEATTQASHPPHPADAWINHRQ